MKVVLFANTDWYLYNFRLALMRSLATLGAEVVPVSPPGRYGRLLEEAGFRWIQIPMDRRSLNPYVEARLIWSLKNLYDIEQPDLVHHFTIKPVVYGSLAARMANVPAVVNAVAGLGIVFSSNALMARVLRPVVRLSLRVALNSSVSRLILQNPDDLESFARSRLIERKRIRLIRGSGVDSQRFRPREKVDTSRPTVLLASRLLWKKGVKEYAEAAQLLTQAGVCARFLLAGEADLGNPDAVPASAIRKWAALGTIDWIGHIEDMAALLDQVDIVVLPTSYGEGVPRILVEAASAGLPLIATAAPGCREIVAARRKWSTRSAERLRAIGLGDAPIDSVPDPSKDHGSAR